MGRRRAQEEGTLEELTPPPDSDAWSAVCSEREICTPRNCGPECFYQRARERTRTAGIVVLNHALFFTLLSMQDADDAYVFNSHAVIFDEAHVLESVAGAGIGRRVTAAQFRGALRRLYNPSTRKGIVAKNAPEAKRAVSAAAEAVDRFFGEIGSALRGMEEGGGLIRIRVPEIVPDTLSEPLDTLHSRLEKLESGGTLPTHAHQELTVVRRTIGEAHAMVEEFIHQTDPLLTYWCEQTAGKNDRIALCASPADVSGLIGPRLFRDGTSAILTSATLAAGGKTDYFRIRIGALDVPVLTLDSPFNYWRQMRLCIARDIPEPDNPEYQEELPEWILRAVDRSSGRALVLFTNNAMMRAIAKRVAPAFEERGFRLLVQGIDGPRHTLLEEFQRDIHSVLFGLDSFWMGVDVPGRGAGACRYHPAPLLHAESPARGGPHRSHHTGGGKPLPGVLAPGGAPEVPAGCGATAPLEDRPGTRNRSGFANSAEIVRTCFSGLPPALPRRIVRGFRRTRGDHPRRGGIAHFSF